MTDARKPQAFVHHHRPARDRFDPPTNRDDFGVKPAGGLWTSTIRDDRPPAWVEWCRAEDWGLSADMDVYRLTVDLSARVFEIDGTDDLARLLDEYDRTDDPLAGFTPSFAQPDYEAMAADGYDAVHVTARGERETRYVRPGLYGVDCESTVWLSWAFESVECLGPVDDVYPESPRE